jgi:hypothetical protein
MDRKGWEDTSCVEIQFGSHPAGKSTDVLKHVEDHLKLMWVDVHE